jgi:LmbE family N-acetylglucosaminyl deacetylase
MSRKQRRIQAIRYATAHEMQRHAVAAARPTAPKPDAKPPEQTARSVRKKRHYRVPTNALASIACLLCCTATLYGAIFVAPAGSPARKQASAAIKTAATKQPFVPIARHVAAASAKKSAPLTKVAEVLNDPCAKGSILNIVAHEDDDILFMNPTIENDIAAGMCVHSVYVTAGDDGQPSSYWELREQGPDAAYATMAGLPDNWQDSTTTLNGHPMQVHTLEGLPSLSLIFLRLPDGNLGGEGFASTNYESLLKLRNGTIPSLVTIDGTSSYTTQDLIAQLVSIMELTKPTVINTQAFSDILANGDHADHQAVGYFTTHAAQSYHGKAQLHRYIGYQVNTMSSNLSPAQMSTKQTVFSAYEHEDAMMCTTPSEDCSDPAYTGYLSREYQQDHN